MGQSWKRLVRLKRIRENKAKMVTKGIHTYTVTKYDDQIFVHEGLCKHIKWPLGIGGKIEDGCIKCPLHQSRYNLENGKVKDWSPFPLFPAYGRLLGKLVKPRNLKRFVSRIEGEWIEIKREVMTENECEE